MTSPPVTNCWPCTVTVLEPPLIPALAAGLPGETCSTRAPPCDFMFRELAMSLVMVLRLTPIQAYVTLPFALSCSSERMAVLIGTAKPSPSLPPP